MRVLSSGSGMTAFFAFQSFISPLLLAQAAQVVEYPIKRVQRSASDVVPTNIYNEQWIYTVESEKVNPFNVDQLLTSTHSCNRKPTTEDSCSS
jgi:hypothetical protein